MRRRRRPGPQRQGESPRFAGFSGLFFKAPSASCRVQEQETALHCAAWHGYLAVARVLCRAGCRVDAKNREGESALLTASARGFVDIVECLAEHDADLETADKVGGGKKK